MSASDLVLADLAIVCAVVLFMGAVALLTLALCHGFDHLRQCRRSARGREPLECGELQDPELFQRDLQPEPRRAGVTGYGARRRFGAG
jgi:hypothetical protein